MKTIIMAVVALLFVSTSQAAEMRLDKIDSAKASATAGIYDFTAICVSSTDYNPSSAREFCYSHAGVVNMLTNEQVMMSSSCQPAPYGTTCGYKYGYVLTTRMSIAE
jgi:hypothetical protein